MVSTTRRTGSYSCLPQRPVAFVSLLSTCSLIFLATSYTRQLSSSLFCANDPFAPPRAPMHQRPDIHEHEVIQYKANCQVNYTESCIIPKVVLLMSFPNSGTSYTLKIAQGISNYSFATSYHKELRNQTVTHVIPGTISPYKKNTSMPLAPYVLTKTHCTGYGDRHGLDYTNDAFDVACRSIDVRDKPGMTLEYSASIISGAVHLFRSPFDNLVARMHLWIKRQQTSGKWNDELAAKYAESQEGILAWCDMIDAINTRSNLEAFLAQQGIARELYQNLPCLTEQVRYVAWHTHAVHFIQRHQLPTLVLYYEWYTSNYFKIATTLLQFLKLDAVNEPNEFYPGKTYLHLFSLELVGRMEQFMKAMASQECWELIQHYFDPVAQNFTLPTSQSR
ncbi:hypothetical protein MPSEU_000305400 [Mayamaea pseudoterrestris]|nr:hypothetical protein MPSEU_000305400 [Mayamaea pseudoterrestris]